MTSHFPPPFALYLMRHGEPETGGRMLGRTDCAVTDAGIAACVAQASGLGIAHIIASDLRRAADCAQAISNTTTSDSVAIDPRWRELDFGAWDGRPSAGIDRRALGAFWADPDAFPPPGGERWSDLRARVAAAITALAPRPTLIVTHGGAIRAALAELCGFSYEQSWRFDLPCAVLVGLTVWPGAPRTAQITAIRPCAG